MCVTGEVTDRAKANQPEINYNHTIALVGQRSTIWTLFKIIVGLGLA
jgi:hypothetical protein